MDFLYRGVAPRYKGCEPAAASSGGLLAGLWRLVGGRGGEPVYRQRDGASAASAAPRAWWQGGSTPAYKAAPPAPEPEPVAVEVEASCGCPDEAAPACADEDEDERSELEIHIW